MTHPQPQDSSTPAAASSSEDATGYQHGDPLLAASQGAQEGTEGSRHGLDATSAARDGEERPESD